MDSKSKINPSKLIKVKADLTVRGGKCERGS